MKNNKKYFYGIYGIEFIWHGAWSDPELIWHKKSFNYFDVENYLYDVYREDAPAIDFDIWVKKNAYLARECLQNLLDAKIFYGGAL